MNVKSLKQCYILENFFDTHKEFTSNSCGSLDIRSHLRMNSRMHGSGEC